MSVPSDWDDKPSDISKENWKKLKQVYDIVEDIDAFTGGVSEFSVDDGVIGATFACVIGRQFQGRSSQK